MLMKMLKYEFKVMFKRVMPFYMLILLGTLIVSIFNVVRFNDNNVLLFIFKIFSWMGFIGICIGISTATLIILIQRYYSSLYGEEGYLTNTLPIKKWKIFIVKVISFYFWTLVGIIIIFLAIIVAVMATMSGIGVLKEYGIEKILLETWEYLRLVPRLELILTLIIRMVLEPLKSILLICFSVWVGNNFRYKLLAGLGTYVGISIISSIIGTVFYYSLFIAPVLEYDMLDYIEDAVSSNMNYLWMKIAISIVSVSFLYFLNIYCLTKKFNID